MASSNPYKPPDDEPTKNQPRPGVQFTLRQLLFAILVCAVFLGVAVDANRRFKRAQVLWNSVENPPHEVREAVMREELYTLLEVTFLMVIATIVVGRIFFAFERRQRDKVTRW